MQGVKEVTLKKDEAVPENESSNDSFVFYVVSTETALPKVMAKIGPIRSKAPVDTGSSVNITDTTLPMDTTPQEHRAHTNEYQQLCLW